MREESLTQFWDTKGGRKVGKWKREETQRVFESQSVRFHGQKFGAYGDLVLDFSMCVVTVLENEHTVVAFKIVKDDDDVSVITVHVDRKGFQVLKHVSRAVGTVEERSDISFVVF